MAGEIEVLELLEEHEPEIVLHVERVAATHEAAHVREHELHEAETDEQHEQRPGRHGADDRVVDDGPLDQRRDGGDRGGADGDGERDDRAPLVAGEEGPELAEPAGVGHADRRAA